MEGVHRVFSVQPSSGAAGSGITDAQKVLYGKAIVDLAVQAGVHHIVYSSADIISEGPTGLANPYTKLDIEDCAAGQMSPARSCGLPPSWSC
ncbi:NmrA-like family protein [Martelella mediterranea]|uniref:NmrA-like family protein n=2 Tax=Martelella mediterranea TaxID=293089 RepID=A0A4R3NGQ2_9HYPH|nr:NmrA-like family protein [Martelella mediterranea]